MQTMTHFNTTPRSWLAFDLNVLRRIEFSSIVIPLCGNPAIGAYLKRSGIRVAANDPLRSNWIKGVAAIQNNGETLSDEDVNIVLEDAYVPGYKLNNPALRNWFNETDSWWFDNVRRNIDRLSSPFRQALAASITMSVGDYARSFTEDTLELRQPLSTVFRRLWTVQPDPVNNGQNNTCLNEEPDDFIARSQGDLMFLRLPSPVPNPQPDPSIWREEWIRTSSDFWPAFEEARNGKLGGPAETRSQYLRLLEQTLNIAGQFKHWAIAHVEGGAVSTQDIVDAVSRSREKVDAVYTKDFSELTGNKAVIVTA